MERKREKKRDMKKEEKKRGRDGKVGGIYTQRPAVPIGKINQENHVLFLFICPKFAAGSQILANFVLTIVFTLQQWDVHQWAPP